jgi:hypothetical protein
MALPFLLFLSTRNTHLSAHNKPKDLQVDTSIVHITFFYNKYLLINNYKMQRRS